MQAYQWKWWDFKNGVTRENPGGGLKNIAIWGKAEEEMS